MPGITPKLPLLVDSYDGHYKLIKDYKELVKQNFKNLVLTSPGERVMDPEFGVGIRNYLFEQDDLTLRSAIQSRISQQVSRYMPFVQIIETSFSSQLSDPDFGNNQLAVRIRYVILPLDQIDTLEIITPDY
jgi:phage baseplate assembly protein W